MKVFYDKDADFNIIKNKIITIVGYGSQGHAHAANLKDSGVINVNVALKETSLSVNKAKSAGFNVVTIEEAAKNLSQEYRDKIDQAQSKVSSLALDLFDKE